MSQAVRPTIFKSMTIDELNSALDARESRLMPFPTDALTSPAADFTRATAKSLNVAESQIGPLVLAVLASGVGNSYRLRMRKNWHVPAILWVGLVADSGSMKTPALRAVRKPVDKLEIAAYKAAGDDGPRTRLLLGDSTIEAVAALLEANPRGLLMIRDELAAWLGSFNKYNRGSSDLQAWLDLENGDLLQIDRKHAAAIVIRHPAVSVIGTIQPGILAGSLKDSHFYSGFAARLLLVYPPERAPEWSEAEPTDEVLNAYERLVNRLYSLPYDGEPRILELSPDGLSTFKDWFNVNGKRIHACTSNAPLKALYGKMPQLATKLALILQLADTVTATDPNGVGFNTSAQVPPDLAVSDAVVRRAIEIAEWFAGEYKRVLDKLGPTDQSDSASLCEMLPAEFTAQDVATLEQVSTRQGRNIVQRLVQDGYAEKANHGIYRKLTVKRKCGSAEV